MRLKDAVFIHLQSAHGPICPWDNYPTYNMYCTLMHSYCAALRSYCAALRSYCAALRSYCAAIAQCTVIMRNAQSYDSCAVMTLTVHVSCTYWDDRYYRVNPYLIYDR